MRRACLGIAGLLVTALAGCSDTGPQEGTVAFKKTNIEQFTSMKNAMQKNVQTGAYAPKAAEGKPATETTKPATETTKPATETTKPATETTKPAAETKAVEKKKE
jgi:hypothetical protein